MIKSLKRTCKSEISLNTIYNLLHEKYFKLQQVILYSEFQHIKENQCQNIKINSIILKI